MSVPADKKGSAKRLIRIPPLKRIIFEGSQEIGRQAREAVEKAVTSGIAVDPERLRKWGPRGAAYFARKLRERIMLMPSPIAPASGSEQAVEALPMPPDDVSEEAQKPAPSRPTALIKIERDWVHQQCGRWSIAARSIFRGQIIALCLLVLVVAILL